MNRRRCGKEHCLARDTFVPQTIVWRLPFPKWKIMHQMKTLETISKLLLDLESKKVRYVHWKSNNNIDRALSGLDDLDILVHPDDAVIAQKVFVSLRFIRGYSSKDRWQPNIFHYYAMEPCGSQLVHLHLHYALTLGYDYHKNYTLPVIDWYFHGRERYREVYLPAPEKEYILLVIRTLIKNARLASLAEFPTRQISGIRRRKRPSRIAAAALNELAYLRAQTDENAIKTALLTSGLPFSIERFAVLAAVASGKVEIRALHQAAAETKLALASTRDKSEIVSLLLATFRINIGRIKRLKTKFSGIKSDSKIPQFGGRIIAFIGGDGAGKSTNVSVAFNIFSRHLRTSQIHIGKPRRSPLGTGYSVLAKLVKMGGGSPLANNLRHLALAHNRLREYQRAQRDREAGTIVVMDRLPHPAITSMDGPRIRAVQSGLHARLAAAERRLYDRISGVDLIVAIKLDPEIACARRPEDDRKSLLERSGEIWTQDWDAAHMLTVNSGEMSFSDVERTILNRVWKELSSPFLRLEILGTTGAGKSTLTDALVDQLSNATSKIPYRRDVIALGVPALQALRVTGVPLSPFQIEMWKSLSHLFYFRKACRRKKITKTRPAMHMILDQGPIFRATQAAKEGLIPQGGQITAETIQWFNELKGIGLFLPADSSELRRRVLARKHQPKHAKLSNDEFEKFAEEYDVLYKALKGKIVREIEISSRSKELTLEKALAAVAEGRCNQ